jgi:hypothetical protein
MKLRVAFHNFAKAPKKTKPFVLVFTGIMFVFLAVGCQGDEVAEVDTEYSV